MNQSEIFYGVVWKMVIHDGNASLSNATCLQTRILIDPPSYSVKYCDGTYGLMEWNCGVEREKGTRKNYGALYKVVVYVRFFHIKICYRN